MHQSTNALPAAPPPRRSHIGRQVDFGHAPSPANDPRMPREGPDWLYADLERSHYCLGWRAGMWHGLVGGIAIGASIIALAIRWGMVA